MIYNIYSGKSQTKMDDLDWFRGTPILGNLSIPTSSIRMYQVNHPRLTHSKVRLFYHFHSAQAAVKHPGCPASHNSKSPPNMAWRLSTAEGYYCGWKKSCTTLDGWNPINNGINHLSTVQDFFHPLYHQQLVEALIVIFTEHKVSISQLWPVFPLWYSKAMLPIDDATS